MKKLFFLLLLSFLGITTNFCKEAEEKIYLNFTDASLENVVQYLAEKKNINFIPNNALKAQKVTLTTHEPLTLKNAWDILLTILEINNFTINEVDGIYRITQSGNKILKEPLPSYMGINADSLPNNDMTIRYVYLFKNINVETIMPVLNSMLADGSIVSNPNINACIITEKCLNIKSALKIINALDSGGLRESIQIIQLKEADATTVHKMFQDIFGGEETPKNIPIFIPQKQTSSYFSPNTKIIPDQRNNTLIMLGTKDNLDKIKNFIAKYIDKPFEDIKSRLHIKELKHTDAQKIKAILDEVIKPTEKDEVGSRKYFEDMQIAAEEIEEEANEKKGTKIGSMGAGNRLVIACNTEDWKRIEPFIDSIDKPQPQISLEILFADISQDDSRELKAQLRNKAGVLGKNVNFNTEHIVKSPAAGFTTNLRTNMGNALNDYIGGSPAPQASYFTFGKDFDIHTLLSTILSKNNSHIISQPYIIISNYKTATLTVAESRIVPGELKTDALTSQVIQNQDRVDAKTSVKIIPAINLEGVISLKVEINLDEFTENQATAPNKKTRKIDTLTRMLNGEVLVIGGLTQAKVTENQTKFPILSSIPIIGGIFKGRSRNLSLSDLYIFIRPTLIKPQFEGLPDAYTQLKLDYSKLLMRRNRDEMSSNDPIQRWYFNKYDKPHKKENLGEEIEQVDDYLSGKYQPKSVNIEIDPFFKTQESRTIIRYKKRIKQKQEILRNLKKTH